MPLQEFDQCKTFNLQEEKFLFMGFPCKINEIVIAESDEGGLYVRVSSRYDTNHFWVKENLLQGVQNRFHAAVMLVRDTMYDILRGKSTGVTTILE